MFLSDPDAVARYAEGPLPLAPGFLELQCMAGLLLAEAGFMDVELFYAGFSFRGWVATA